MTFLMIAFSPHALAVNKLFIGINSTDYNDPANWSPPGVPGINDTVTISDGLTVNINQSIEVEDLIVADSVDTNGITQPATIIVAPGANIIVNNNLSVSDFSQFSADNASIRVRGTQTIALNGFNTFGELSLNATNDPNANTGQNIAFTGDISIAFATVGDNDTISFLPGSSGQIGDSSSIGEETIVGGNAQINRATIRDTEVEFSTGADADFIEVEIIDVIFGFEGQGSLAIDGSIENATFNGNGANDNIIVVESGDDVIYRGNNELNDVRIFNEGTIETEANSSLRLDGAEIFNANTSSNAMRFTDTDVTFGAGGGIIEKTGGGSDIIFDGGSIGVEDGGVGTINGATLTNTNTTSGTGGGNLDITNGFFQHNQAGQYTFAADTTLRNNTFHTLSDGVDLTLEGTTRLDSPNSGTSFYSFSCSDTNCNNTIVNLTGTIELAGDTSQFFTPAGGATFEFGDGSSIVGSANTAAQAVIGQSSTATNATVDFTNMTAFITGIFTAGQGSVINITDTDFIVSSTGRLTDDGGLPPIEYRLFGNTQLSIDEESDSFLDQVTIFGDGVSLEASASSSSDVGDAFTENGAGSAFYIGTLEVTAGSTLSLFDAFPAGDYLIVDVLNLFGDILVQDGSGNVIPVFYNTLNGNGSFIGLAEEVSTPATVLLLLLGLGAMKRRRNAA